MPDKKLTDNEIVKAREDLVKCNNNEIDCDNCSLSVFYPRCPEEIGELSFDLINRLQAENEKSKNNCDKCAEKTRNCIESLQNIIAEQQAENERLKKEKDEYAYLYEKHINTAFSHIKAEAYKEFAEEVFELFPADKPNTVISRVTVKYILKKLVGEDNV